MIILIIVSLVLVFAIEDFFDDFGVNILTLVGVNVMLVLGATLVGLATVDMDDLYAGELIETYNIATNLEGEYEIGLTNNGGQTKYIYTIHTDRGKQAVETGLPKTYVKGNSNGEATVEKYKSKYKSSLLGMVARNLSSGYTIINVPTGHKLAQTQPIETQPIETQPIETEDTKTPELNNDG